MYLPKFSIIFILAASILSCKQKNTITDASAYNQYLQAGHIQKDIKAVETEIEFWGKRLAADTSSYVNKLELATYYLKLYKLNGNITNLLTGDSLLKSSSAKVNNTIPEILYSLAQTSIGQHQFTNAALYTTKAVKASGDKYTTTLLQFDASMELGNYNEAYKALNEITNAGSFDYLIRKAKWEDHTGNLDKAIETMEAAFIKVKDKKTSLYCWTLSNLGDMYGHAGRLKEAYQSYIAVLKKDPSNLYCLKGIARIAWLHDNNPAEAKRIVNFIVSQTNTPDLKLMLAELHAAEGDTITAQRLSEDFINIASSNNYGTMYNKYLIELYTEDLKQPSKALELAQLEINNRATPEAYDLLAWSYFMNGKIEEACTIATKFVYNKTFEPEAMMHTALIYAAAGKKEEAKKLLAECKESSFELGPVAAKKIDKTIAEL
jgi:tetratricopeptide (TPR) repeat protein